MKPARPFISVIVPAHNAASLLPGTLGALRASDFAREYWELIVVDDASSDDTAQVAAEFADTVVRLSGRPHGPAYARNRGIELSRGEVVAFVDSDIEVHSDALGKLARHFAHSRQLAAVFGSYDAAPREPAPISRYRNLLHHHHHHRAAGAASTFWAGLGAIRRSVLDELGGFDEWHYARPQIEDIELGRRMVIAGFAIRLDPGIQGTHLKRWTLTGVIKTDMFDRGIPWMRLMEREGVRGSQLNVGVRERVCVAFTALMALFVATGVGGGGVTVGALGGVFGAVVVWLNREFHRLLINAGGPPLFFVGVPMHFIYYGVAGLGALAGILLHRLGRVPAPPDFVSAVSDLKTPIWPPAHSAPVASLWSSAPGGGGRGG